MSTKTKGSLLATTLLLLLSIYSYGSFTTFKPKTLIPVKEIKGVKTEDNKVKLPFPQDYTILGRSQKDESEHITYKTPKTPEEIQTFYRNILISRDWEIDTTGSAGIFTTTKYKLDKKQVDITTSQQENEDQIEGTVTIVSLLIKN